MSTDITRDGEDRRLPATWEELQRARREAFKAGVKWERIWRDVGADDIAEEARARYPITKRVPRPPVRLQNGCEARVTDRGVLIDGFGMRTVTSVLLTPSTMHKIADLVARPYDEVSE